MVFEDRMRAIESLFDGDLLDEKDECINPLNKNYELASRLSVEGTPTIFLEDGRVIPGYQNYKNILEIINQ